jgi:hypothetical protein
MYQMPIIEKMVFLVMLRFAGGSKLNNNNMHTGTWSSLHGRGLVH